MDGLAQPQSKTQVETRFLSLGFGSESNPAGRERTPWIARLGSVPWISDRSIILASIGDDRMIESR